MDKNIEESIIIRNNKMVYAVRLREKDSSRINSNPYLIISDGKIMYIDRVCSGYTAFNFSDAVHQTAKEIFVSGLRAAVKESLLQLKQLSLILDEMGLKDCLGDVVETNAKGLLQDNNEKLKSRRYRMEITKRLNEYAKACKEEPTGREVDGTVELLEEAADYIDMLNKETEKYRKKAETLKDAAKPLVDYLYKYGTPHDAIVVRMDAVEHLSGETVAKIDVRD